MTAWYTPGSTPPSSTSPSSTAGPTNPTIPNWSYTGCYTDVLSARVLSGITFANLGNHNTTTTGCVSYCNAQGYSIAGTEYGGQCFCDNSLASASTKVGDDKCNMACEGDGTQLCGGGLTLTVYTKGGSGAWKEKRERRSEHFGRVRQRFRS
jgi:WSC domain